MARRLTRRTKERISEVLLGAGLSATKCPCCGSGLPFSGHRVECKIKQRYYALSGPLANALGGPVEGVLHAG